MEYRLGKKKDQGTEAVFSRFHRSGHYFNDKRIKESANQTNNSF